MLNKDSVAAYAFKNADEAMAYYERCLAAEKVMGPLSESEKLAIIKTLSQPITVEDLADLIAGKRVLSVKTRKD